MNNSVAIVTQLIRRLQVPVTFSSIKRELEEHPDFPSLLTISDVLRGWRVENVAYEVSIDELKDVPVPFLAHVSDSGGKFIIVNSIDEQHVSFSNDSNEERQVGLDKFSTVFTGNVMVVNPLKEAGEQNYALSRRHEIFNFLRLPFIVATTCIMLLITLLLHSSYVAGFDWQVAWLTLTKGAGVVVSVLLLIQTIDVNNPLVRRLCYGKSKHCRDFLSSRAAKLLGGELSWSEVGLFYFGATWLILLFNTGTVALKQSLAVLNLLALPYTFYSIYYQARVARQWCVLCCVVQALLWLEFVPLVFYLFQPFIFPGVAEWGNAFVCALLPVVLWMFVKPHLLKSQQLGPAKEQLRKFKYNEELFTRMLTDQPRYHLPADDDAVTLGNVEAERVITIVTNPFCSPCSKAHRTLEQWLSRGDEFKLQVVFSPHESSREVAAHIMALNDDQDKLLVSKALNDWYAQDDKNYKSWAISHPAVTAAGAENKLKKQQEWCNAIQLEYTPTILINGYKLPKIYQLEDIRFFI